MKSELRSRVELFKPSDARGFLDRMTPNRPVVSRHVARLAATIKANEWELNGESIKYDVSGYGIDGQHRALAVLRAEMGIETLVVRGLPPTDAVFYSIDHGQPRNVAALLARAGETNVRVVSAALNWVKAFQTRKIQEGDYTMRFPEAHTMLKENPGLRESCAVARLSRHVLTTAISGAFHYAANQRDPDLCETFFEILRTGVCGIKGHMALRLREALIKDRLSARNMGRVNLAFTIIRAWNAARCGSHPRILVGRRGAEKYPIIQ